MNKTYCGIWMCMGYKTYDFYTEFLEDRLDKTREQEEKTKEDTK